MLPVLVGVAAPGTTPGPTTAISRTLGAIGAPLARCRPVESEVPVTGTVAGSGGDFPARCEAIVDQFPGFDMVVVGVVSPPTAPPIDIRAISREPGATPGRDERGPAVLTWWRYIVTEGGIHQIGSRWTIGWQCGGSSYFSGGSRLSPCRPNH
jgi:hypothetical protein